MRKDGHSFHRSPRAVKVCWIYSSRVFFKTTITLPHFVMSYVLKLSCLFFFSFFFSQISVFVFLLFFFTFLLHSQLSLINNQSCQQLKTCILFVMYLFIFSVRLSCESKNICSYLFVVLELFVQSLLRKKKDRVKLSSKTLASGTFL